MTATVRWAEDRPARSVRVEEIAQLWADIETEAERPVITVFHVAGAELHAVIGEATGTVLGYFPPGYEQSGIGSLHSIGNRKGANSNEWQPPLVAYYLGHYSEFSPLFGRLPGSRSASPGGVPCAAPRAS